MVYGYNGGGRPAGPGPAAMAFWRCDVAVSPSSDAAGDGILGAAGDVAGGGLADRGIGFQAAGFAAVLAISTTVLQVFDGSGFWLYQWFETAMTGTYWSAVAPLAAFFDWGRKMFERGKAIREAKKEELRRKYLAEGEAVGEAKGEAKTAERYQALLKTPGVVLPPEVADAIFGDDAKNGA